VEVELEVNEIQQQQQQQQQQQRHPLHGAIAKGMILPKSRSGGSKVRSTKSNKSNKQQRGGYGVGGRKKDPSYRQHHHQQQHQQQRDSISPGNSPTAIALRKRRSTLPTTTCKSQSLLDAFNNADQQEQQQRRQCGDVPMTAKKTRSDTGIATRRHDEAHSYGNCTVYQHATALENVNQDNDDGVEDHFRLKPSQVNSSYQQQQQQQQVTPKQRGHHHHHHHHHPVRSMSPPLPTHNISTNPGGMLSPTPTCPESTPRRLRHNKSKKSTTKKKSTPIDVDSIMPTTTARRSTSLNFDVKHKLKQAKISLNDLVNTRSSSPLPHPHATPSNTRDVESSSHHSPCRISIPSPRNERTLATSRSAPTDNMAEIAGRMEQLGEIERGMLDAERLLSQMGMDVSEEDYCIEGEFGTPSRTTGSSRSYRHNYGGGGSTGRTGGNDGNYGGIRNRCHSYDCNYDHPLERAYEDFGVERKLVELNPSSSPPVRGPTDKSRHARQHGRVRSPVRSMKKLVRHSLANIGNNNNNNNNNNNDQNQDSNVKSPSKNNNNNNNKVLKTKVLSILCGKGLMKQQRPKVPQQIVATSISTTPSQDENNHMVMNDNVEMTLEDMQLLYRWQNARCGVRVRNYYDSGSGSCSNEKMINLDTDEGPTTTTRAAATTTTNPLGSAMNFEDVLSITSSCGDKTLPMDNRRKCLRTGFSF